MAVGQLCEYVVHLRNVGNVRVRRAGFRVGLQKRIDGALIDISDMHSVTLADKGFCHGPANAGGAGRDQDYRRGRCCIRAFHAYVSFEPGPVDAGRSHSFKIVAVNGRLSGAA